MGDQDGPAGPCVLCGCETFWKDGYRRCSNYLCRGPGIA